jgi:putative transposase
MPRLRHYDNLSTARFITFCCYHRYQLFIYDDVRNIFIESLKHILIRHRIKILAYVLMPEHVHMVLFPPDHLKLGRIIGTLKSFSGFKSLAYLSNNKPETIKLLQRFDGSKTKLAFWQKRCYDHNCRTVETSLEKIKYCHKNPVHRGLVEDPADWAWSSYNWYMGKRDVPLEMDEYPFI